jgi:hypothetical protein
MTQVTQLRVIPDSETFSPQTRYLGGRKVEATFSLRRDAKSARFEKKCTFDFSKVTEEQLFLLAMYSAKVKLQAILRNLTQEVMADPSIFATVDVKADLLEAEKQPSDPVTAAIKSIQKAVGVTEEAARAILEQAKSKAEKAKGAGPIKTLLKAS